MSKAKLEENIVYKVFENSYNIDGVLYEKGVVYPLESELASKILKRVGTKECRSAKKEEK